MTTKTRPNQAFSAEDLTEALRGARVGVWDWDIPSNFLRWSDETLHIYGMRAEDFHNSFESFMPRVHPDDRVSLSRIVNDALAARSDDFVGNHRVLLPDGGVRWVEGRGRVINDADGKPVRMLGTVIDATERHYAEERMRETDERLRLFTAHATDYVYDASMTGQVAVPNIVAGSFERTTGMTAEEVAARGGWAAVIHPDDRERSLALLAEMAKGRSVLNEYRIIDSAGKTRWLRDRIVPVLDENGVLTRIVGGVTDINEQRALEERLVEAQRMEALARLAAGVAHDFNNLLTVLNGELAFVRDPTASRQDLDQSLAEIDATLVRATRLTSSLLAFGRKQVGPLRVIDLGGAIMQARTMLMRSAGERVNVQVLAREPDLRAAADQNDVHLVLLNLALNARDAMPDGGSILIDVTSATFTVDSSERPPELKPGRYISIAVTDTGTGIPEASRAHIFQPFFTTKGHGGTGLGLPTCLGIVERYGGALYLKQSSPAGTTFQIYLPRSDKAVVGARPVAVREMIGGSEHILLVEDDAAVRSVTERGLRARGYEVTAVYSSEDALALGDALGTVDMLLTDVRLPGISGLDLAAKLREALPLLPVLVMSGHVEDPRQQAALTAGKYAFLAKPFSLAGLLLRLREVLEGTPRP
jgi:two-component system, cell cycle sensor histidine kinase and response regulator CckA